MTSVPALNTSDFSLPLSPASGGAGRSGASVSLVGGAGSRETAATAPVQAAVAVSQVSPSENRASENRTSENRGSPVGPPLAPVAGAGRFGGVNPAAIASQNETAAAAVLRRGPAETAPPETAPPPENEDAGEHAEPGDLSQAEEQEIRDLQERDREVRQHEAAHARAGGEFAGSPTFEFTTGPDGQQYAVSGQVAIDVSPVDGDPQATLEKARTVQAAANAPASPSAQDRAVAAQAAALQVEAQAELAAQTSEEADGDEPAGEAARNERFGTDTSIDAAPARETDNIFSPEGGRSTAPDATGDGGDREGTESGLPGAREGTNDGTREEARDQIRQEIFEPFGFESAEAETFIEGGTETASTGSVGSSIGEEATTFAGTGSGISSVSVSTGSVSGSSLPGGLLDLLA